MKRWNGIPLALRRAERSAEHSTTLRYELMPPRSARTPQEQAYRRWRDAVRANDFAAAAQAASDWRIAISAIAEDPLPSD